MKKVRTLLTTHRKVVSFVVALVIALLVVKFAADAIIPPHASGLKSMVGVMFAALAGFVTSRVFPPQAVELVSPEIARVPVQALGRAEEEK